MTSTGKEQCTFTPIKGGFQFKKTSIFGDHADSTEVQVAITSFTEQAWGYAKEIARSENIPELSDIWEEALGYFNVEFVAENLNDEYRVKSDKDFLTINFYAHYFRGLIRMPMFTVRAPIGLLNKMTDDWCWEQITLPLVKQIQFEKCNDTSFDFIEIPVSEKDSIFSFNKKINALTKTTNERTGQYLTMKGRYLDLSSGSTGIVFYDGNGVWELAFSKQDTVNACRALFGIKETETKIKYMTRVFADMNTQVGFYCESINPLHSSVDWKIVKETDQTGYFPMEPGFQVDETAVKIEETSPSLDFDFPSIVFDVDAATITQKGLDKLLSKTDEADVQKAGKEIWLENPTANITQPVFGLFTSDLPKWMEESPEKILLASKYACNTVVGHEKYTGSFIQVTGCFVLSYGNRYYVSTKVNSTPPQIAFSVKFQHNDPRLNYHEIVESMSWSISSEIDKMFIDCATTSYDEVIAPIVEQKIKAGLKDSDFVLIMPDTQRQEIGMVVYLDLKELGIMEEVIDENWVEWDKLYSQQVRQRLDYWSGLLIFMCKQAQEKFNYVSPVTVDEVLEEEISKLDLPK